MSTDVNSNEPPLHPSARMYWFLVPPGVVVVIALSALFGAFEISLLVGLLGVLALVIVYGRDGWAPGPLYFYEVLRLARGKRGTVIRCLYGIVLLIGLCILYAGVFSADSIFDLTGDTMRLSLHELSRFAEQFMMVVVSLQSAAVILLTPAYLAGAIAEEKEQKTLELLFTTHLSNRQIVIGKMLARLTHLVGVLLTGLPILSLTQLFGGVSAELLLCHFIVAGLTLLSIGSVCILCSVQANTVLGAMVASYFVVIAMNVGCLCPPCIFFVSPFGFGYAREQDMIPLPSVLSHTGTTYLPLLIPYIVVHGGIALFCLIPAVRGLRQSANVGPEVLIRMPPKPPPAAPKTPIVVKVKDAATPTKKEKREVVSARPGAPTMPAPRMTSSLEIFSGATPPVSNRPLLWKEMYHGASGAGMQLLSSLATVGFLGFAVMVGAGILANLVGGLGAFFVVLNPSLRVMVCSLGTLFCLGAGIHAAGSVVRERAQKTLQSLLLLPVERWELLGWKFLGSIARVRYIGYFLAVVIGLGLFTGAFHPLAVLFLVLACSVHVCFAAAVGLAISVYCRTMLAANFLMALFLFIWFAGSGLLLAGTLPAPRSPPPGLIQRTIHASVNPPYTYWLLGFPAEPPYWPVSGIELAPACFGLVIYAGLAFLCWRSSCSMIAPHGRPREPIRESEGHFAR